MVRTTVTLDGDAESIVRRAMAERGVSFKQALNDAIRGGAEGRADVEFRTQTFDMGEPAVDLTKALQLSGDLEDEELIRKLRAGR